MSDQKFDMRGVLFKNDQGGNPKRPNYRGTITVLGVDYNLSGWIKKSQKSGDSYMSLAVDEKKPMKPRTPVNAAPQPQGQLSEDNWHDDSIPF